jgi:GNAT superfamily N-acetyltransferase
MKNIEIIDVNSKNISKYGVYCVREPEHEGYQAKLNWCKKCFSEGLKLKLLYSTAEKKPAGFIEYIPGENAWRGVDAKGYEFIHCILIMLNKYKKKGYGTLLLKECLKDAKDEKMNGVAVVTREGTWMAGKELFLKNGFEIVDQAPPDFELLVKKFKKNTPSPKFKGDWEKRLSKYKKGLIIIYSGQCPYIAKSLNEIIQTAKKKYGLKPKVVELKNYKEAQAAPSPFAIFSMIYNGKLVADHPISNTRFKNIMNKELR